MTIRDDLLCSYYIIILNNIQKRTSEESFVNNTQIISQYFKNNNVDNTNTYPEINYIENTPLFFRGGYLDPPKELFHPSIGG